MSNSAVLFGYYPGLPDYIRNHGRQRTFAGGHAVVILPGTIRPTDLPPFLSEFDEEFGPITGCTESSAAMAVAWQKDDASIASPNTREALQNYIKAPDGTNVQDDGVGPTQLLDGVGAVLKARGAVYYSWTVIENIGPTVWLGDPLSSSWMKVPVADLKNFCAGKTKVIGANMSVVFAKVAAPTLPDTSTEEDMTWASFAYQTAPSIIKVAKGTTLYEGPGRTYPIHWVTISDDSFDSSVKAQWSATAKNTPTPGAAAQWYGISRHGQAGLFWVASSEVASVAVVPAPDCSAQEAQVSALQKKIDTALTALK